MAGVEATDHVTVTEAKSSVPALGAESCTGALTPVIVPPYMWATRSAAGSMWAAVISPFRVEGGTGVLSSGMLNRLGPVDGQSAGRRPWHLSASVTV